MLPSYRNQSVDFALQISPFKRQPQKMGRHAQAIRRLLPTNCLSRFDHFVGLALQGLKKELIP